LSVRAGPRSAPAGTGRAPNAAQSFSKLNSLADLQCPISV
jgi:hypothetical protein